MLDSIISFSIRNKALIGLMTLGLIAAGIWSALRIPLDAVPDITNNQVQVITQAPNLGTEDIEQFVTYPVELAMANLPGVVEIRSVSRFGLSVVTIVFEDEVGTYLPRQLVSEKLTEVRGEIPEGFGEPFMGPISTGLGEIYQYTLEVDSAHQGQYSATELRTIQDWIIRRQMAMVPGVVEVNAFGGQVKQYEVAVNPNELKAIGLTISDVFAALEANNQNTGGAYIEKDHYANFIRGEGLARNIQDLENIVVSNQNGVPITIGDIAKVQIGKAVRYGAFTKDGQGEAVGGMILMLKGANSNDVVSAVKDRMEEIQPSLPEGVHIQPFIERSSLIKKTTGTVSTNLIEGALIVILVLVLLLGNWRGGLIVASTIPLSLLFAFVMMKIFGVWANLMSLGAIDFGIIVDGAVIIVEGTVFLLHNEILKRQSVDKELRDELAGKASKKMMRSAFFGQLIILIVFIPLLSLQGVEGKMFKPMALTFMFAMLGAMILCLTYVPMMAAWFLRVKKQEKKPLGERIVDAIGRQYAKLLNWTLKMGVWLVGGAVVLLVLAGIIFSRMGGEFVPQLDEGDLAYHVILKPGSSLSETVKTTTLVEQKLLAEFPEIQHIFSRIGVAEVPTDPMPMDIADVIVILAPEDEWVSASSKPELIEKMRKVMETVPGVNYEFTQPIEMRFNELLTGVREDVAVKLFGEDLDMLAAKAEEMGRIISTIDGVADLKVEATSGLPQLTVKYDRGAVARYGLQISELNMLVQTAFGGGSAGVIFEGEKRFDLVVRLDEAYRSSLQDLENLYVPLPDGSQIPLRQVADISYEPGPMQISRDNTNRRTYVGINVEGRDVQSLVAEIKAKLDAELELPPGYYIRYGGEFENLERASKRLKIVVPIALAMIFILIYFALGSFKQTAMIYAAIPLATIGGVFALWLRDMPFSISAGVGFIVLFGVAVLNGLVLINGWNELKEEGMMDIDQRIKEGAKRRLRPILLTALTDMLGFFPMAISGSAGAEVQRPLATVVIGGMLSATLLTLFVLPVLYRWVEGGSMKKSLKPAPAVIIVLLLLFPAGQMMAQHPGKTVSSLEEAIDIGLAQHPVVQVSQDQIKQAEIERKTAFSPPQTNVTAQFGQYNSYQNDLILEVDQEFAFPTLYANRKKLAGEAITGRKLELKVVQNQLKREIRTSWFGLALLRQEAELLAFEDSLLEHFRHAAEVRYQTGATGYLEQVSATTRLMELENRQQQNLADQQVHLRELRWLLGDSGAVTFAPPPLEGPKLGIISMTGTSPGVAVASQNAVRARAESKVVRAENLPHFTLGYFNQSMIGAPLRDGSPANFGNRFSGVKAGVSVPVFAGANRARREVADLEAAIAETRADLARREWEAEVEQQEALLEKHRQSLLFYEKQALPQADLILEKALKSYENGAIGYVEYVQSLEQALEIKYSHLKTLYNYHQTLSDLKYLLGQ